MPKSYESKTVLITGGTRGIGAATALYFAKKGYKVFACFKSDEANALNFQKYFKRTTKTELILLKADVSKEEEVQKLLNDLKKITPTLDCLVNNAGIAIDTTLEDKTVANFHKILDTNLIGPFLMCKYFGNFMFNNKKGNIVNISSTNGIDSFYPYSMDYDASKAGLISLTHNFAVSFAPFVRVNTVAPGWVNTDMNKELDPEYIKKECQHILLERFANPEEIAESIYFAAESSYLNDSIIKIDGGRC